MWPGFFLHAAGTAALFLTVHWLAKHHGFKSKQFLGGLVIAIVMLGFVVGFLVEILELPPELPGFLVAADVVGSCVMSAALYLFVAPSDSALRKTRGAIWFLSPALFAAAFATMLKVSLGGWVLIPEIYSGLPVVAAAFHALLRRNLLDVTPPNSNRSFWLLSDGLFLLTGLLHWDMTTGGVFTTIDYIIGGTALADTHLAIAPMMDPEVGLTYNFLIYVPVALAWVAMVLEFCLVRDHASPVVSSPR